MIAIRNITIFSTLIAGAALCFFPGRATAQDTRPDSLDRLIRASRSDTQRIRLLGVKANIYSNINLDSSIAMCRQAIKEAEAISYTKAIIANRATLSSNFCFKGQYDSARLMIDLAMPMAKSISDSGLVGRLFAHYGMMEGMQGQYDSSNNYYEQSIPYFVAARDSSGLSNAYRNLGTSLQMQSRFSLAMKYVQMALKISEARKDLRGQAFILLNMGAIYSGIADSARSEQSYLRCIDLSRSLQLVNVQLYACSDLANLYIDQKRYAEGYKLADSARKLAHNSGDNGMEAASTARMSYALGRMERFGEAASLAEMAIKNAEKSKQPLIVFQANTTFGDLLGWQNKFNEAIPYYETAIAAVKTGDLFDRQFAACYRALSEAYEKVGRPVDALKAFRSATRIQDSIVSKDNVRKTTENAMNAEFDKKEAATRLLRDQEDLAAKNKQKFLLGGLIFMLLLAAGAWYAFSIKRNANVLLEQQKTVLQKALGDLKDTQAKLIESEKMASLGELTAGIAHEIQNPLNFVNNFSEVSMELIDELKAALAAGDREGMAAVSGDLTGNLGKILHHGKRADAIVKGMLQHSRSNSDQKELTDLNTLADEYLRLSYHGLRAKNKSFNATLHTDFDASMPKTAVVTQDIGRVILNLLTNAFYAIDEKQRKNLPAYQPSVWVSTRNTGHTLTISVRDNGNGIPEKVMEKMFQPFFTTKPAGQGTGLGLSLSYDIIKAHGGEITVESKTDEGTQFRILLPFLAEIPKESHSEKITTMNNR